MRRPINEYLRGVIRDFVARGAETTSPETEDPAFTRVWSEVQHFHRQTEALSNRGLQQFVAVFYDEDDKERREELGVPIQAPNLNDVATSYAEMVELAGQAGLRLRNVSDRQALQTIFTERLSEHMAQMFVSRALTAGGGSVFSAGGGSVFSRANTVVESNRSNDTVLYAKGFFFASTGQAFGTSTPAEAYVFPGRYSFGILESGNPRFEPVIWSCPRRVRLSLP